MVFPWKPPAITEQLSSPIYYRRHDYVMIGRFTSWRVKRDGDDDPARMVACRGGGDVDRRDGLSVRRDHTGVSPRELRRRPAHPVSDARTPLPHPGLGDHRGPR